MESAQQGILTIEPESPRFAVDLVFVHGLWTRPEIWQPVAAGFAQRGWRCLLVDARPDRKASRGIDEWSRRIEEIARRLERQPIVIGHDAGGLVGLALAQRAAVSAAIAVAPLLDGPARVTLASRRIAARILGSAVPPPLLGHPALAALGEKGRARLHQLMQDESGACVASLRGAALVPGAPRVPTLLVAQEADEVVPRFLVELTARGLEADYQVLAGGHWPMLEERIDAWTGALHRWIIKRLGESILLLRGDEDLG